MSIEGSQVFYANNDHQDSLLTRYVYLLLKYKSLILIITSLVAAGSIAGAYLSKTLPTERNPLPNIYESTAHLLIKGTDSIQDPSTYVLADALGFQTPRANAVTTDYGQLSSKILASPSFIDAMVEKLDIISRFDIEENVRTTSRNIILKNLKTGYDPQTGYFTLSYTSTDPEFACTVVNTAVEQLNMWFSTTGSMNKKRRLNLLDEKLTEIKHEISVLEEKIKLFQRENNVLTKEELTSTQSRMLIDLRTQLVLKEVEIRNYSKLVTIEDPAIVRLRSERKNLADLIKRVEEGVWIDGLLVSKENLPDLALEFEHMQIDLALQRRVYETIAAQYELAKLSLEDSAVFQVIDNAEVAEEKVGPHRIRLAMMATFVAFMATVMMILLFDRMRRIRKEMTSL